MLPSAEPRWADRLLARTLIDHDLVDEVRLIVYLAYAVIRDHQPTG